MYPVNPLKYAIELDAERYGYKNGEEYVKEYGKVAAKAAVEAGLIISTVALGSGALAAGSRAGVFARMGTWAKNIALKAWGVAKSVFTNATVVSAHPTAQKTLEKGTEFINSYFPASAAPQTWTSFGGVVVRQLVDMKDVAIDKVKEAVNPIDLKNIKEDD